MQKIFALKQSYLPNYINYNFLTFTIIQLYLILQALQKRVHPGNRLHLAIFLPLSLMFIETIPLDISRSFLSRDIMGHISCSFSFPFAFGSKKEQRGI